MKAFFAVMICASLALPLHAEGLSVTRKVEIPTYQNNSMAHSALVGVASGLAVGAGVGFAYRQMMCRNASCPNAAKTIIPSLLVGTVVGAGVGAFARKVVGNDSRFVAYPTVGIGSYGSAPGLVFEGRF